MCGKPPTALLNAGKRPVSDCNGYIRINITPDLETPPVAGKPPRTPDAATRVPSLRNRRGKREYLAPIPRDDTLVTLPAEDCD